VKRDARAVANALEARIADHLVDLDSYGRDAYRQRFGRVPYVVDVVFVDQGFVDEIGGPLTAFGHDVAGEVRALQRTFLNRPVE
jgi:hypothetical protein